MAVWLQDLKKQYLSPDGGAVPVIDIPAFRLENGEHLALVGGSGTGKTTLLHLIAGILQPDRGSICFGAAPPPADAALATAQPTPATLPYRSPATAEAGVI